MIKKLIAITGVIIIISAGFFFFKSSQKQTGPVNQSPNNTTSASQDNSARIVSTKPDPLMDGIVSANDPIEITFNKPLQNIGEFKVKMEPKVDFKITLSSDRKTGIITFTKPLELGMSYTLSIGPDTKFDGAGAWGQSKDFHFRTVTYNGV